MEFVGLVILSVFVGLVVIVAFAIDRQSKHDHRTKGEQGEAHVDQFLRQVPQSVVVSDIILVDDKTGRSSQIDHVVIRPNGVFVIETKNYAGSIYGDDNQRQWTQVLAYGQTKNKMYNPVKQNSTHIWFLGRLLRQHNIYINVVVFLRAELHVSSSNWVCSNVHQLSNVLQSDTGITLTQHNIDNIVAKLTDIKSNPQISKQEHIINIHNTQADIANNICPRCAQPLRLREGKFGQFYGCSGYPKCRFVKDVD
ncbi:MAG: NERD domain-containing protein [Clostridiales bacterium]|jgi:hypothetical protein|nr:NERD domain-containing protein [Clostridiales bacterium]